MMQEYNENAFSNFDTQAMVPCQNCKRTFLADRLEIHARSCKAGKPLKMRVGLQPKVEKELSIAERRILGKVAAKPSPGSANQDLPDYEAHSYGQAETKVIEQPTGSFGRSK